MRIKTIITASLISMSAVTLSAEDTNLARLVDPAMGLGGKGFAESNMFPGATFPFGMVQMTPSPFASTLGFAPDQLNGTGGPHMGHFPMLPYKGSIKYSPGYMGGGEVRITDEKANAGYYEAYTQKDVHCEFTVSKRTGMARISFPQKDTNSVIIGTGFCSSMPLEVGSAVITSPHSCEGYAKGTTFCYTPTPYIVYFAAEFDQDAIETGTWKKDRYRKGDSFAEGCESGIFFTFKDASKIGYRIALSYVSVDNARMNLHSDGKNWDFDQARLAAETEWNKYLSKIEIQASNQERARHFYTHLYHSLIQPNLYTDANGEYMGSDFKVHKSGRNIYSTFSNWDTYRTQIQLISILEPQIASDIVYSHQMFAEQTGGALPRWSMLNIETGIMQGEPSSILIANAWAFGARSYDEKKIYEYMMKGASTPGFKCQNFEVRPHLQEYIDMTTIGTSLALEYCSADFAIAQFSTDACKDVFGPGPALQKRAQNWKKAFNPENKWLQTKKEDGSWKDFEYGWGDFMEASYQAYFWMVPFNIQGLIDLIGPDMAEKRLDEHLSRLDGGFFDDWFAICNEPSFQIPWTYNWLAKPWKTSEVVNRIINESFSFTEGKEMPGNEDVGAMGSWYVFACTGLYPFIPGIGGFTINTPIFEKVVFHLQDGDLVINGGSESKIYTKSLKINGKDYDSTWIPWSMISKGAVLDFKTSVKPDMNWGKIVPPSYNE